MANGSTDTILRRLVAYNVILAVISATALVLSVAFLPYDTGTQPIPTIPTLILAVMSTMAVSGVVGGTLCNLRGLFKYIYDKKGEFPLYLKVPYYLRPLIGGMVGLLAFFVGHFLTSALSDTSGFTWTTLAGRLPYIAVALLAGFVSQEFAERMKAVANTLFSQSTLSQLNAEEQLRRLKTLKDENLIAESEYNQKRQSVVDRL